jgi:hypothetical protein
VRGRPVVAGAWPAPFAGVERVGRSDREGSRKPELSPRALRPCGAREQIVKRVAAGWIVGLIVVASGAAHAAAQQPKLSLSAAKWDFGTVWHGELPRYTLVLTNEGLAELRITRVMASCGCTAAEPEEYTLAPGEQTDVAITYNTQGKQGKQSATVTIFSNDPAAPESRFEISGDVKRAISTEPIGGLVMRGTDPTAKYTARMKLINNEPTPMKVRIVSKPQPNFEFEVKETVPGKEVEITARNTGPLNWNLTSSSLLVETGLTREPNVSIPVTARMYERVNLVPPVFLFTRDDPKPQNRGLSIEYFGKDDNFKILKVECKDPRIKLQLGPLGPPPQWQVDNPPTPKFVCSVNLQIPPAGQLPESGVPVEIHTNDPDFPVCTLMLTTKNEVFQALAHRNGPTSRPARKE